VEPDRLHRVRRPARTRRAIPRPLRDATGMAHRRPVRAGNRSDEPAAGPGLDAACDLLRVAPTGPDGSTHRRTGFHSPRPRDDPRAVCSVSRRLAARVDTRRRDGSRRRDRTSRRPSRAGGRPTYLATHDTRTTAPHPDLRARRCGRGSDNRTVARAHPAGVRRNRADVAASARRRRRGLPHLAAARNDRRARRDRRADMDGIEGRRACVRRRVRDCPADANPTP
jgi:hypothetical protein